MQAPAKAKATDGEAAGGAVDASSGNGDGNDGDGGGGANHIRSRSSSVLNDGGGDELYVQERVRMLEPFLAVEVDVVLDAEGVMPVKPFFYFHCGTHLPD